MATGRVPTTANSPLTTKGDLFTYDTSQARLAVGSNGETLVADSSTSTGLRYTAGNPIPNPVLNSAMDLWQRGTSISVSASGTPYTTDRWQVFVNANQASTVARQLVNDSTNLPSIQYCSRVQRNSGQTGTGAIYYSQSFESSNSVPFAGKTVTLSFYARKGADYSAASSVLVAALATGTGTDQNLIASGYTGSATPISQNATLTTTWQRFTYTGTLSATANEITIYFGFTPVGTASTNDYFEVTGVQLDVGNVALPFRRSGNTLAGELAACKRYLPSYDNTAGTNNGFVSGYAYGTNSSIFIVPFDVAARVSPTGVTVSGTINAYALNTNTGVTPTFDAGGINSAGILASHTITAGQGARLGITSGAKLLFTGCEL